MDEEKEAGAVADTGEQTTEATKQALTIDDVQALMKEEREKTAKEWQSRFDKLLAEKKQEQERKMTVEERLAQIEAERQAERLEWVRKEAKVKAGLDDELEQALFGYASTDAEKIQQSAEKINSLWAKRESAYKDKIAELETRLQYGSKPPQGGAGSPKLLETLTKEYESLMAQGKRQEANLVYIKMSRLPK